MSIVQTASDEVLRSVAFRHEFRAWLQRQPESRRDVFQLGSDVLCYHLMHGGSIITANGEAIRLPPGIFDDVHGEDGSGVWISEQRRNVDPKRRYAERLLPRLRLYDAIGIIGGNPITNDRRRIEVAEVRDLLGRFNRTWRVRYGREIRRVVEAHRGQSGLMFGAAVRRLRNRFQNELDLWEAQR